MLVRVSNLIWNICWSFVACCSFMISNFKTSCEGLVKFTHLDTFMFIKLKEKQAVLNQTQYQRSFGMLNSAWFLISPFLLPASPSIIKASFGAFHPRGREKSNLSRFGMFWITGFPSSCQSLGFPNGFIKYSSWNHKRFREKRFRDENLRVAIPKPKARSFDEVSNDKGFRFIYIDLSLSIYVYGFDWLWPCWNTSTWPSSCRRRPLSRTPKTSRIHNLEGAVGCLRGKKTGHNKSRFLSKQENITENLLQGQISVHHDNFQVSTCIHQSGSNKFPTTLAHDSFNLQISRVNDLESPLNFTRLVHVPNIQLLLLDSTCQSAKWRPWALGFHAWKGMQKINDASVSWNNRGKCFHEKITRVATKKQWECHKNVDPKWWGRHHFDRVYIVAL